MGRPVVLHSVSLVGFRSSRIREYGMAAHVFLSALLFGDFWEHEVDRVSNFQLCIVSVIRFFLIIVVQIIFYGSE